MNKKLFKYSVIGFVFVSVLGSVNHFVFEWSNYNKIIGLFTPVNESTWEHLKLLFFPYLIWTVIEYFLLRGQKGVFSSKLVGALVGMTTIVMLFYTYIGAFGKNNDVINILIFFIGVLFAFATDYILIKSGRMSSLLLDNISIILFALISALFFLFTFEPPLIPLFKDPVNSTYGI